MGLSKSQHASKIPPITVTLPAVFRCVHVQMYCLGVKMADCSRFFPPDSGKY